MAKIDTTKITGFEEMSAEDKIAALMGYEFETPAPKESSEEVTKLKNALSKANSECAEWKKALREKQTEAERAEAERKEREAAVEEELRTLRKEKTVSGYVAQCLALGYDNDLAIEAANAMADNDAAKIFDCQQKFLDAKKKEYEATALNKQPGITPGAPPTAAAAEAKAQNEIRRAWGLPPIPIK